MTLKTIFACIELSHKPSQKPTRRKYLQYMSEKSLMHREFFKIKKRFKIQLKMGEKHERKLTKKDAKVQYVVLTQILCWKEKCHKGHHWDN